MTSSASRSTPILNHRYQLIRYLNKRSGRQTLLAQDLAKSDQVVLKFLLFGSDFEWASLKLFEREAQILQTLDHPAIPKYRDYFEVNLKSGRGMVLAQSYIDAPSLQAWIQQGQRFNEAEVKGIAQQLLKILDYLHTLSPPVIHRDIKPSNILLKSTPGQMGGWTVYLVDFGSVQAAAPREEGTYTVVGSYGYMPLEQFGGKTVPASDLYALGATLIYLLTARNPADLAQAGSRIAFEKWVSVSSDFQDWICCLVEPSVADRPQSATEALNALQNPDKTRGLVHLSTAEILPLRPQPHNSGVKVSKTGSQLEIKIPSGHEGKVSLLIKIALGVILFPFVVPFFLILLGSAWAGLFFVMNLLGGFGKALAVVATLILSAGVSFGVLVYLPWRVLLVLHQLLGDVVISLDHKQVSLWRRLFQVRFHRRFLCSQDQIKGLEILTQLDSEHNPQKSFLSTAKTSLNIWVGDRSYPVGTGIPLSKPEVEWLAAEISHWGKVPVQRRSELPKPKKQPPNFF